jgi:hypothetical protein
VTARLELRGYVERYFPDPLPLLHVLEGRLGLFEREGLVDNRLEAVLGVI